MLKKIRDAACWADYMMEISRSRLTIVNTIMLFIAVVKVYDLSKWLLVILIAVMFVGIIVFGWLMDRWRVPHKLATLRETRNPALMTMLANDKEILSRLERLEARL